MLSGSNNNIAGVSVIPLTKFEDHRGKLLKMIRRTDPYFTEFGEVYFSTVNPGVIKGWKIHDRMGESFAVPYGNIQLVLYDARPNSPTVGSLMDITIGENNYCLVKIPPQVWYGFRSVVQHPSMIANCADMPHEPGEGHTAELSSGVVPYQWQNLS